MRAAAKFQVVCAGVSHAVVRSEEGGYKRHEMATVPPSFLELETPLVTLVNIWSHLVLSRPLQEIAARQSL